MNIYQDEAVVRKLEELGDQVGYLVLDLVVLSLKTGKIISKSE